MPAKKFYDDIREQVKKGEEMDANPIPLAQRRDITVVGNSPAVGLGRGITKVGTRHEPTEGQRRGITVFAGDELCPGKGAAAKESEVKI